MPAALIGSALAPVVGGIAGKAFAGGSEDEARAAREAALQQIMGIPVPELQQIALQRLSVAGQLTPEALGTVSLGPTAMEGVSTDPRLREAQMKSLETLQGLSGTGLSAADRVALMDIRNQAAGESRAAQESILQNLAQRGMAGGGQELASRMIASQAAADTGARQGLGVAAQAQERALQALMGAGQLGGQIRTQEFGEQSDVARAKDIIEQWNAANRQNVMSSNVQARRGAEEFNLRNLQDVMNKNVGLQQQEEMYKKQYIPTQQFSMQAQKAGAAAGALGGQAQAAQQQAQATQQMWGGIGQGVGSGLGTYAAYDMLKAKPTGAFQSNVVEDPEIKGYKPPRMVP